MKFRSRVQHLVRVLREQAGRPQPGQMLRADLLKDDHIGPGGSQIPGESDDVGVGDEQVGRHEPQRRCPRRCWLAATTLDHLARPHDVPQYQHHGDPGQRLPSRQEGGHCQRICGQQQPHSDSLHADQHRLALRAKQSVEPDDRHTGGQSPPGRHCRPPSHRPPRCHEPEDRFDSTTSTQARSARVLTGLVR